MQLSSKIWMILLVVLCAFQRAAGQDNYQLLINFVDKDTAIDTQKLGLKTAFADRIQCAEYASKIPTLLLSRGYLSASLDSVQYDSTSASAWIFLGDIYRLASITIPENEKQLFQEIGWNEKTVSAKKMDFEKLEQWQLKTLGYLENHGYPFASVQLDSMEIRGGEVSAKLKIDRGPLYKIDSIRVSGNVKINNFFLQKYLGIENGSIYKKDKLSMVSPRLRELPYLQESRSWELLRLGTGATLDLYLKPRKSSQIDVLIGFLPDNSQKGGKLLLTGDANINLKNALGGGETIGARWQQLQVKSPRLNLQFQQPYLFHSSFGLDFAFDLYKKDSAYINLNTLIGLLYTVSANQTGKVFFQSFITNLLTVDTGQIKSSKKLPPYLDVSSTNLGIDYQFNNTDYRFNPRLGNELGVQFSGGIRKIRENNTILQLYDESGNGFDYGSLYDTLKLKSYTIRARLSAAHYFKLGRQATLKAALNGGIYQTEDAFINEVFQLGGYRLLRGFDEESIYATQYFVITTEYRYLIGQNSYLFGFIDGGWARNDIYSETANHSYLGTGLGIAFETKAGIFNISYAVGKTDETSFNFRQSKIHFGFVSLF